MPIEKRPSNPLPTDDVPPGGIPYKFKTNDDLGSVARKHGVPEECLVSWQRPSFPAAPTFPVPTADKKS